MSGLTVRAARRSEAKPLIGFYDKSGGGKTLSALFLARGFVGKNGKIGMIESESGRGEAHTDTVVGSSYVGGFEVVPIWDHDETCPQYSKSTTTGPCKCSHQGEPFSSQRYSEAITAAEQARWDALIIDSASHEWEGLGGVLHAAEMKRQEGAKGMQVWTQAKVSHQRHFIGRLLQTPIPLVIICMRAKYPMEEEVNDKGRKEMKRSEVLIPKQDQDILFEMFVHGHFAPDHKFYGTKYTKPELANVLRSGEVITNATGEALAKWAAGGKVESSEHASILQAIAVAETEDHVKAIKPRIAKLAGAEREDAIKAATQQLEEIKRAAQMDSMPAPKTESQ